MLISFELLKPLKGKYQIKPQDIKAIQKAAIIVRYHTNHSQI